MTAWLALATTSLLGSLHCAGMCGGLVGFYSACTPQTSKGVRWLSHLAYHLSRLLGYSILGAVAGTLGSAVDLAGERAGLSRTAALVAGGVMVAWGAGALLTSARSNGRLLSNPRLLRGKSDSRLQRTFSALARRARSQPPVLRAGMLGLASALLPCGWLYTFAVLAAGTASALEGSLVMAALWAGGVPALLGLGVSARWIAARIGRHLPKLSATLLVALGLFNIAPPFAPHPRSGRLPSPGLP